MKLRTAIVEDQKPDAERLEQLLKKAFGEEEILCRRFVCGDDFLKEFPGEGSRRRDSCAPQTRSCSSCL